MNTVYRTFISWNSSALAAGFENAADEPRQPRQKQNRALGGDNVIDLTAWREANLEEPEAQSDWEDEAPELEFEERPRVSRTEASRRRERRSRRLRYLGELISTVSVVAAAAVLILRVLMF